MKKTEGGRTVLPRPRLIVALATLCCLGIVRISAASVVRATDCGARGDGSTLNTVALQQAIDRCGAAGGGRVQIPAGRFITGTLELRSGVTLHLDPGAELLGSINPRDYRNVDPFMAGDGIPQGYALLVAKDATGLGIEGEGAIDGRGPQLVAVQPKAKSRPFLAAVRPFLVRWIRCSGVRVRGVRLRNAGAWGMHFFQCTGADVEDVTIDSRSLFNNDGIDIDSCDGVRITGCNIDSGDDAICLKATSPRPCRRVFISSCSVRTRCNAFKLGTESLGDFARVSIEHCRAREIGMSGIAIYDVDGAHLEDVKIRDLAIDGAQVAVSVRLGARLKTFRPGDQPRTVGTLRGVAIDELTASQIRMIGILANGIPQHRIEDLTLRQVSITVAGGGSRADAAALLPEKPSAYPEYNMFGRVLPAYGVYLRHVAGAQLDDVRITPERADGRPQSLLVDVVPAP